MNTKKAYALRADAAYLLHGMGFKVKELAAIFKTTPWPARMLVNRGARLFRESQRPSPMAETNCLVTSRSNRKPATECAPGSGTGERAAVHRSRGAGPRLTRTISIPKRVGDAWADA